MIITGIVLLLVTFFFYRAKPLIPTIKIDNSTFYVDLAVTGKEIEKGLGGRESLKPLHGMLFLFNHKDPYPFWMAGMKFPLDFIWIDGNKIVEITKNVPVRDADNRIPRIIPNEPVDKVLEINAGETDLYNIKVGDTLIFNK